MKFLNDPISYLKNSSILPHLRPLSDLLAKMTGSYCKNVSSLLVNYLLLGDSFIENYQFVSGYMRYSPTKSRMKHDQGANMEHPESQDVEEGTQENETLEDTVKKEQYSEDEKLDQAPVLSINIIHLIRLLIASRTQSLETEFVGKSYFLKEMRKYMRVKSNACKFKDIKEKHDDFLKSSEDVNQKVKQEDKIVFANGFNEEYELFFRPKELKRLIAEIAVADLLSFSSLIDLLLELLTIYYLNDDSDSHSSSSE